MTDDVLTLDSWLTTLRADPAATLQRYDLHEQLSDLGAMGALPTLIPALRDVMPPSTFSRLAFRAWGLAWATARPDLAEAWHDAAMGALNARARKGMQAEMSPAQALFHLSSQLWRMGEDQERWSRAFAHWVAQTPNANEVVNRPLGWFTSVLLWHLHERPDLIGVVRRQGVALDLDLPIQRWMGSHAGYLTGVPNTLSTRQAQPNGPAWTLLSVAMEQATGVSRRTGSWAHTAIGLINLGASLDAPSWTDPQVPVGDVLLRWAEAQPSGVSSPRWEEQQVQALVELGRRAPLLWTASKVADPAGPNRALRPRL